ncbi:hypothetical protein CPAV1605_337 [seawater metagenome]|uniref:Uncharacterized protein n=1 Tax=seawater metagenome TaxID=1561972 RepID=A0A5E8CLF9_9ZZZZ
MEHLKKIAIVLAVALIIKFALHLFVKKPEINLGDRIRTLIRQASRWSIAASQDESPIIAVLHANYGAGYLWALLDIASENEITASANINLPVFKKKILDIQDQATKKVSKQCPQFVGSLDKYLATLGGDV